MGISKQEFAIQRLARILRSIEIMLPELEQEAVAAQYFTLSQDERIKGWFVKFLALRVSL